LWRLHHNTETVFLAPSLVAFTFLATRTLGFGLGVFDLSRRNPNDMDGVADHVGGAF
jgi:hypothetical protein